MSTPPSALQAKRASIWDVQFDPTMTPAVVQSLLAKPPFADMDRSAFPDNSSLDDILLHECALRTIEPDQVVIRQGDYGTSAFFLLTGRLAVWVNTGQTRARKSDERELSWLTALKQSFHKPVVPEVRDVGSRKAGTSTRREDAALFIQDLPGVVQPDGRAELQPGALFGEASAVTRTPRSANIVAMERSQVLEITWQGLRALMRFSPALKQHVDNRFRKDNLYVYLRSLRALTGAADTVIKRLADAALFERHGRFDWHVDFKRETAATAGAAAEPVIVEQGSYPNGIYVVRSGFVRISRQFNHGEQTLAYLGKGECFGLQEAYAAWSSKTGQAFRFSLRAIGYADIILLPTAAVEKLLFETGFQPPPATATETKLNAEPLALAPRETGLLEFLVENRFINGTKTMLVNTDRCTGCDECIRACADAHDGNSRFVREGPKYENLLVANACMHCHDPVCMIGCPTGAIQREADQGYVHIQDDICIGCATCSNSCPYNNIRMTTIRDRSGAIYLDESRAPILKATKCDFCMNQLVSPACQNACPHDALVRMDVSDSERLKKWRS
ncbi:cyclic nucleotide-binding domain-containing protein [Permianibacter sp. IMCC34836]|uniref:cyclic nucleotide-binding domain-containing protein n=1 Tax=Permianibacter fluminis TaxID=2738515 RepID=UPI001556D4BF|nr:cyclic nucleotide-binding domain-containing protein [Permianibacter fluminis]NQD35769.1 cyclic nucleotide-binding domain-containing protein [Permianibacter fluminis]